LNGVACGDGVGCGITLGAMVRFATATESSSVMQVVLVLAQARWGLRRGVTEELGSLRWNRGPVLRLTGGVCASVRTQPGQLPTLTQPSSDDGTIGFAREVKQLKSIHTFAVSNSNSMEGVFASLASSGPVIPGLVHWPPSEKRRVFFLQITDSYHLPDRLLPILFSSVCLLFVSFSASSAFSRARFFRLSRSCTSSMVPLAFRMSNE